MRTWGYRTARIAPTLFIAISTTSCVKGKRADYSISQPEAQLLARTENPFSGQVTGGSFAADDRVSKVRGDAGATGTDDAYEGYLADSITVQHDSFLTSGEPFRRLRHCTQERYEKELRQALDATLADDSHSTVIVQYSYSFGLPNDETAKMAYYRSILRKDDDGLTPVPYSVRNVAGAYYAHTGYYFADHKNARKQYITGERCFFSIASVGDLYKESNLGAYSKAGFADAQYDHWKPSEPNARAGEWTVTPFYFGVKSPDCSAENCAIHTRLLNLPSDLHSHYRKALELYEARSDKSEPLSSYLLSASRFRSGVQSQAIKVYVADIRDQRLGLASGTLVNASYASNRDRGAEYDVSFKAMLNLVYLWQNREALEKKWNEFYEGAEQLIDNIIWSGSGGSVTAAQYTPIVLDLPIGKTVQEYESNRNIRTASLDWGTFFNAGNFFHKDSFNSSGALRAKPQGIHHLSAWVGGDLKPIDGRLLRRAADGLLVLPRIAVNSNGQALSCSDGSPQYDIQHGIDLLGAMHVDADGKAIEFDNGFMKLRSHSVNRSGNIAKACDVREAVRLGQSPMTDDEIKKRYVGPWDADLYASLKVWLDSNRNGFADCGEVLSLKEARIAAINTCNVVINKDENGVLRPVSDVFGNQTHLRAAYLVSNPDNMSQEEIFKQIREGKTSDGKDAEFRVAIDILFKASVLELTDSEGNKVRRPDLYLENILREEIRELRSAPALGGGGDVIGI